MEKIYTRNCPDCGNEITYNHSSGFYRARTENRKCKDCKYGEKIYKRDCPTCGDEIIYNSNGSLWAANKRDSNCRKCFKLECGKHTGSPGPLTQEHKDKISASNMGKNYSGGWIDHGYRRMTINGVTNYEHRFVMEAIIGRILETTEVVHHKDYDKLNNHPDNLEIMDKAAHDALIHKNTGADQPASLKKIILNKESHIQ